MANYVEAVNENENDAEVDQVEGLPSLLEDGQCVTIRAAGHEKQRYVSRWNRPGG